MSRLATVLALLFALIPAARSNPMPQAAAPPAPNYARSAEGYANQFNDIVAAYRAGDRGRGLLLIDYYYRVPDEPRWFAEHFPAEQAGKLMERYDEVFAGFATALDSTIRDLMNDPGATITSTLGKSTNETPDKQAPYQNASGLKSVKEMPLSICNFTIHENEQDAASWAKTVTYDQGAFRLVGSGAWPFWAWDDNAGLIDDKRGRFVRLPVIFDRRTPLYPETARRRHIQGEVVLEVIVGKDGMVKKVTLVSGDPILRQAAIDAVQQWRFSPGTMAGETIETNTRVTVNFSFGPPPKK